MSVYNLPEPIQPREKAKLFIKAVRQYRGFPSPWQQPDGGQKLNLTVSTSAPQ